MINIKFIHKINSHLHENGYTIKQEIEIYNDTLIDVINNTREYLDELEFLREYKVRWKNYSNTAPTTPYKYTLKGNLYK